MRVPELAGAAATAPREAPRPPGDEGSAVSARWLAVVGLLALAGFAIRLAVAHESLFADELSTYWISGTHGLHGVLSLIYGTSAIKHAEITPPLSFVASWVTLHLAHTPVALRLPSLLAGTLTIPVLYLLGTRTVGRRPALVATALATVSPFMIFYSTEARAYGLLMLLVTGSTLSMLLAVDTGRRVWWWVYAACAALAFWTHNTCLFVLAAQLVWVLWAHPEARRAALLATLGAVIGVLPWLPGFFDELHSPTLKILSALAPFDAHDVWVILGHWAMGYPYGALARLTQVPGDLGLALISVGTLLAVGGLIAGYVRARPVRPALRREDRIWLLALLLVVTPVAEALFSAVSTHIFGLRNLAASWPALALVFAYLVIAAGRRIGPAAAALVVVGLALGAARMVADDYGRPDYGSAARYVERAVRPGDAVIDETGDLSPGPLTGFDVALSRPLPTIRALAPAERDHPFTLRDPYVTVAAATGQALAQVRPGGRVFVVGGQASPSVRLRLVARRAFLHVPVAVYATSGPRGG